MSGIGPVVIPHILPDPPPNLAPGQQLEFKLMFGKAVGETNASTADAGSAIGDLIQYGATARAQVTLRLDGEEAGGFVVKFAPGSRINLPYVSRN